MLVHFKHQIASYASNGFSLQIQIQKTYFSGVIARRSLKFQQQQQKMIICISFLVKTAKFQKFLKLFSFSHLCKNKKTKKLAKKISESGPE